MKEEIRRIMKLVQEGKLTPEDGAELIEAFSEGDQEPAPDASHDQEEPKSSSDKEKAEGPKGKRSDPKDPFAALISSIEQLGKDVSKSVNWQDVAKQVRGSVMTGVDAAKKAVEEAKKTGSFSIFIASEAKKVEMPLEIPAGKVLRIEGHHGDVLIRGGAEVGSVKAMATFRGMTSDEAKKRAEAFTLSVEESDQHVMVRLPEHQGTSVDLELGVATGTPVEIRLTSGDVSIERTHGSIRVHGRSGDVSIADADGSVDISLASGNVRIEKAKASVMTVETKSGDLTLKDLQGAVTLRTSTGDVSVSRFSGRTLSVDATTGDVDIDVSEPNLGGLNVRAVSGDIRMSIPDGCDCRVALSTLRGSVSHTLELQNEVKEGSRLTGTIGSGEGTIDASTVNGSVRLQLRDSSQEE